MCVSSTCHGPTDDQIITVTTDMIHIYLTFRRLMPFGPSFVLLAALAALSL
jgi:hypothetical protein